MARSNKIKLGNLSNITGEVSIAGLDTVNKVKMIYKQALPSWKNRRGEVSQGVNQ